MSFSMPDSWYEPPEFEHYNDCEEDESCRCEERGEEDKEDYEMRMAEEKAEARFEEEREGNGFDRRFDEW